MNKHENIYIRTDAESKALIKKAAKLRGLSASGFCLSSALAEASRIEQGRD